MGQPDQLQALFRALLFCVILSLTATADEPLLTREAFSREYSIHVGGVQTPLVRDISSREVSIFVGAEPVSPYAQAFSRELSLLVTTLGPPARVTQLNVGISPTGDRAALEWCGYNEIAQSDVIRYRIYVALAPFTTVSNLAPHLIVPAGTCSLTISNLTPFQDHYFAVVAEDALGGSDPVVDYSAAYVLAPQANSREYSLFVGGEPAPTYASAISREVSLLVTTPTVPDRVTPVSIAVSPVGDSATLNWGTYNELLQRDVVRYAIYLSDQPFNSVTGLPVLTNVPVGTSHLTIKNLPAYKDHYFAVVAVDGLGGFDPVVNYSAAYVLAPQANSREFSIFVGSDPASPYPRAIGREVSILVPDNTVPEAVTGVDSGFDAVTSVSAFSAVDLSWIRYNEFKQRDVLRYRIYTGPSFFDTVSGMTPRATVPAGTSRFTLGGLFGGAIYYVAVVAEDVLGNFDPAVYSRSAQASIGALGEVRNLVVTSFSNSLRFTWTAPEQVDAFLHHYNLYLGGSEDPIALTNTALSYLATGLHFATGYPFRLSTVDTIGLGTESAGVSLLAATWLPNPTNIVAQSFDGLARLMWTHAEPNELVKSYNVYRSTSPFTSVSGLTPLLTTRTTRADLSGLVNGTQSYFAVTTVNLVGGEDPVVQSVGVIPASVAGSFADLAISNAIAPAAAFQGQTIEVRWSGKNVGSGVPSSRGGVPVTAWVDRVVLSPDDVLGDADDVVLADIPHSGSLNSGGSYPGFAAVRVPTNLFGIYRLAVVLNAESTVYEHLDAAPNLGVAASSLQILRGSAPTISLQPTNTSVPAYSIAQLVTVVSGSPTPTLQWRVDGIPLAGQTNETLTLTNVQPWQAGLYDLIAENAIGSATSTQVNVRVLPAQNPNCLPAPLGLVGWWPGDGNAHDLAGGKAGTMQSGASFTQGIVGSCFNFDGIDDQLTFPSFTEASSPEDNFTLLLWVKPLAARRITEEANSGNMGEFGHRFAIYPAHGGFDGLRSGAGISVGVNGVSVVEHADNFFNVPLVYNTNIGEWAHVAVAYQQRQPRLYLNGRLVRVGLVSSRSHVFALPSVNGYPPYGAFAGNVDELLLANRALTSNEIAAIYAAGSAGMCKPEVPPGIVAQPTNVTVFTSQPAELRVGVVGDEPLRYQWRFNGAALAQGTNATLRFPAALPTLAGDYDVIVANPLASVTSVVAHLTVRTDIPDLAA